MSHFIIIITACLLQTEEPPIKSLIDRLTAETVTADELKAVEAALVEQPPSKVLPLVLPLIAAGMPAGGIYNSGGVETDYDAPKTWRNYYSAHRVWRPLAFKAPDVAARLLVNQLPKTKTARGKSELLAMIQQNWSKAAEPHVVDIVKNWKRHPDAWLAAAYCLAVNERMKYDDLLSQVALAQPEDGWKQQIAKAQFFQQLFRHRSRALFSRREPTDSTPPINTALLSASMKLLNDMEDAKPGMGYFLALAIADYVGEEFKADQDDPRFKKGEGGVNDAFFAESSMNALRWWKENQSNFEEKEKP